MNEVFLCIISLLPGMDPHQETQSCKSHGFRNVPALTPSVEFQPMWWGRHGSSLTLGDLEEHWGWGDVGQGSQSWAGCGATQNPKQEELVRLTRQNSFVKSRGASMEPELRDKVRKVSHWAQAKAGVRQREGWSPAPAVWCWAVHLILLCLSCLNSNMGIIIGPAPEVGMRVNGIYLQSTYNSAWHIISPIKCFLSVWSHTCLRLTV